MFVIIRKCNNCNTIFEVSTNDVLCGNCNSNDIVNLFDIKNFINVNEINDECYKFKC
jgi:Zn finger protein HypA/HybF involved in hydrogenase expression